MESEFWHSRWSEGRIGFHQAEYNGHLQRLAETMPKSQGGRVLVPLSGKTKDLTFLTAQGHEVVAVEIVHKGASAYYEEADVAFDSHHDFGYPLLHGGGVQTHVADFFSVDPGTHGPFDWVYDRAALVALPPELRKRYVPHMLRFLEPGGQVLLLTFGYDQDKMAGPPFAVLDEEVQGLFEGKGTLDRIAHEDILDRAERFRRAGLTRLTESVWRFTKA